MTEVLLRKDWLETMLALRAKGKYGYNDNEYIEEAFQAAIEWLIERNVQFDYWVDEESYNLSDDEENEIAIGRMKWDGPTCVFEFEDMNEALLFRLRWA